MTAAITENAISINAVADSVRHSGAGALVTFEGIVRDKSRDTLGDMHSIQNLEYEAYIPMAEREMARVMEEVESRWQVRCSALHRVGKLQIGDVAVVIAVSSAHRGDAFEACRFAIDRIKETVPIWKKEVAHDGTWWVENPVEACSNQTHAAPAKHPAELPQMAH